MNEARTAWLTQLQLLVGLPVEHLLNALSVASAAVCITAVAAGRGHAAALLISLATYRAVADHGQVFLSFQWEQLLIETGFIALVCAPLWGAPPSRLRGACGTWLLRFLLFKLMLMSGVVKLQANCPTWIHLTATQYHYTTQPLPTAAAQLAHFMPVALHKLSVAATLVIEIPATLLLLVPLSWCVWWGCVLQIFLQVLILLTGNYTFFNLLTVLLAAAAAAGHTLDTLKGMAWLDSPTARGIQRICLIALLWSCVLFMFDFGPVLLGSAGEATPQRIWHVQVSPRILGERLTHLLEVYLPQITYIAGGVACLVALLCGLLPPSAAVASCSTATEGAAQKGKGKLRGLFAMQTAASVARVIVVLLALRPLLLGSMGALLTLHMPALQQDPVLLPHVQVAQAWRMSSGYGLFRVMTGVAQPPPGAAQQLQGHRRRLLHSALAGVDAAAGSALWPHFVAYKWACLAVNNPAQWLRNVHGAWGAPAAPHPPALALKRVAGWTDATGVPIAVPARPEIQLQGRQRTSSEWSDVSFGFKPGGLSCTPPLATPHQPRLDWQMWFAALGPYGQSPWAVVLQFKLLQPSPHVVRLLASLRPSGARPSPCCGHWPFGWEPQQQLTMPPANITVDAVARDWLRWMLPPSGFIHPPRPRPPISMRAIKWEYDFALPQPEHMQPPLGYHQWGAESNGTVWRRRHGTEWLPPLGVGDPSLRQAVRSVAGDAALAAQAQTHGKARAWCRRVVHRLPSGAEPCVGAPLLRRLLQLLGMAPQSDVDGVWLLDWWLPLHMHSGVQELLPAALAGSLQWRIPVVVPMLGRWRSAEDSCFAVSPNQWGWFRSALCGSLFVFSTAWSVIAQSPAWLSPEPLHPVACESWACTAVVLHIRGWWAIRVAASATKALVGSPGAYMLGCTCLFWLRWGKRHS